MTVEKVSLAVLAVLGVVGLAYFIATTLEVLPNHQRVLSVCSPRTHPRPPGARPRAPQEKVGRAHRRFFRARAGSAGVLRSTLRRVRRSQLWAAPVRGRAAEQVPRSSETPIFVFELLHAITIISSPSAMLTSALRELFECCRTLMPTTARSWSGPPQQPSK